MVDDQLYVSMCAQNLVCCAFAYAHVVFPICCGVCSSSEMYVQDYGTISKVPYGNVILY